MHLSGLIKLTHFSCTCYNTHSYIQHLFSDVFVQLVESICPNCQMYLSYMDWSNWTSFSCKKIRFCFEHLLNTLHSYMQPLLARHVVWNSKQFQLPVKTENVAHWPAPGCSWSKTFHSFNFYNNCNPNQPSAAPRFCFKLQFSDPDLIVSLQENKSHLSFKYPFKFKEKSDRLHLWRKNLHFWGKNLTRSPFMKNWRFAAGFDRSDQHSTCWGGMMMNVRFNQWPLCQWQCLSLIVWKKWYWWQWLKTW